MKFTASTIEELRSELEVAFEQAPQQPAPRYACTKAQLPDPALFINCAAYATDLVIGVFSDGTNWRRDDNGVIA